MQAHDILTLFWALFCAIDMVISAEDLHQCKGIRTKRHAQISNPPNIGGSWFSPRCEIQPGPQYLLRQYEFSRATSKFTITRYYYSDEFCSNVSYAIQASGQLTPQSKSWYLNEATEMYIELMDVYIKPYTTFMSTVLKMQVFREDCVADEELSAWKSMPYRSIRVNSTNTECLKSLAFSVNELLVMRQVDYYSNSYGAGGGRSPRMSLEAERELQLGDGVWFSLVDRPSSYQPPLYSFTHKHCEACQCIYKADIDSPPTRCHGKHWQSPLPYNVSGHWFSQSCESVPNSLFTLRSYKFKEADSTFNITNYYFTDAFCTQQSFVISAEGSLVPGQPHSRIYNTKSYQLQMNAVFVGVLSEAMKSLLELGDSSTCGHVTEWHLNELYDITHTNGCDALGLKFKDSQYVLIKKEQHHISSQFILVSEMKDNPKRFEDQVTHFTPKLKQCSKEPLRWVKRNSAQPSAVLSLANACYPSAGFIFSLLVTIAYT